MPITITGSGGISGIVSVTASSENITVFDSTGGAGGLAGIQTAGITTVFATSLVGVTTAGITTAYIGAINDGPISGARNRIINGDMRIDQRNAGASVTPTAQGYTLDRWRAALSQSSKYSVQQSSTSATGFTNSLLATSLSAYTVGAAEWFGLQQSVEGFNASDLAWGTANAKTVTLSFWVRSSLTGTFGGSLANNDASRSYPFSYTISSANTFEYKTVTIAGDTSGTWLTTNGIGIRVTFGLGVGSTFSNTASAWAGGEYYSATAATSVVGTNGATFYITGVQLEAGSVATPFERRSYGQELALCQRYFVSASINVSPSAWNATPYYFPVTMRATPTVTGTGAGYTVSGSATNSGIYHYQNSFGISTVNAAIEL